MTPAVDRQYDSTGRLDGRVALITGAGRGLGLEIARMSVARGAHVCLVDVDDTTVRAAAAALLADGAEVMSLTLDVSDAESGARAVAACLQRWGTVDLLVNNAGIGGTQVPLWKVDADEWRRVMAVNLDSVFYFCKAAVPVMMDAGYGRIVNMASIAGKEGNARNGQYSTSKGAVITYTKSLGKELATTGVLVNAVAPAVIETDIISGPGIDPEVRDILIGKIPMGRMGRPEEVARLVGFLLSEEMTFSTGAVFDISGGRATY